MPCTRLVLTHPIIKTWVTGCTARPETTEGTPGVVLGVAVGLEATIKIRGTNVTTIMAMIIVGVTHAEGVPAGVEGSGVAWLPVAFLDTCLEIEGKYLRDLCMEFFERLNFFCFSNKIYFLFVADMEVMDIDKDQDGVGEVSGLFEF